MAPIMQTMGGATPLMYACQQSREYEVLDILMKSPYSVKERDRTLKTPLHYCVENSNTNCAEAILKIAPELVNAQDENGYCPLHLAVIAGNKPLIKLLIAKGADINMRDNEGHSAVHWAIVSSEKEALDMIIQAGADPSTPDIHGGYPLHYAVQMCGSNYDNANLTEAVKVVQTLLRHGINVSVMDKDDRQPILWAASAGSTKAIAHLISNGARVDAADKDGLTALHCAASRGHTDTIETLVTLCGAEVDIIDGNGCSALFYAVTLGHADSTAVLLKLGAQPNRQDRKGRTPAHCGAAKGQLETLKILKKHGGDLWMRNVKGDLPFHEAVASGRKDLILWLLEQNPEAVNIGNNDGRSPLHVASMYNNSEMIKVLLDAKSLVNPVMRSSKGVLMTPLNVALCKGHRSCAKFLQLHGGVPFSKVSKSEASYVHTVRNSPSKNIFKKSDECEEEIVSPSFRVINKSHNLGDQVQWENGERRKVYRRRKKRKNVLKEKLDDEIASDSDTSLQNLKLIVQPRRPARSIPGENVDEDESDEEEEEEEAEVEKQEEEEDNSGFTLERRKNADENAITSIILSEDNIYVQQNEKENKRPSITVNTVEGIKAESKLLQKNVSLTEKNVSSLSPEDFPPTMESINQLDSEITETEVDGTKTSIENVAQGEQKENSSETAAAKISEETTGDKESNTSEVSKTDKGQKNEDDVSSKSSKLASSSFTVLDDNSFGKESGVSNSSDITGDSKTEKFKTNKSFKEGGVQKNEKSTKIVHSKSTTIRKYEKTTKTALKKDCRGQSDEKSVSNSEQGNEKVTKMYKTNKMNDEKSEKTKANDNTEEFTEGTRQDLKVDTIHEADNLTETPQDTDNIVASEEIAINESTVTFTEAPTQSKKPIEEGDSNTDASEIKASKETTPAEVTDKDDNEKNETETELKKSEEISEEKKEKPSEEWNSPSFIEPASLKFENPVGVHEEIVIAEVYESEPSLNLAEEQKSEISEDHSYQLNATNISSEQKEDSLKPTIEENPNRISVALDEENAEPLNEESKEVKTNDDTEEKILKEPEMKNAISATDIEKFIENEKIQSSVVQVTNTEEKKALENTDGVSELISLESAFIRVSSSQINESSTNHMLLSRGSSSVCRLNSTSLRSFRTSSCIVTEQKNTTEQINVSDIPTEIVVNDNGSVAGFSPTQLNPNPSEVSPSKDKKKKSKRKSNKLVDPHEETKVDDHKSDRSGGGTSKRLLNDNAEATASTDDSNEGHELLPRKYKSDNFWIANEHGISEIPRVARLCRRNKDLRDVNQVSVNQLVQGTIRKYNLERGIFYQLLELKRLQIRAGRANEQVLVKRLVDEYEKSCASLGTRHYTGVYRFKEFEKFLYDQLKTLNRGHLIVPEMKSYDDIDVLSGILKKSRFRILSEFSDCDSQCACITQRCHHTNHAYTSVPCSAYVTNIRRNKTRKHKKESFLPRIDQFQNYRSAGEKFESHPPTLELIQGNKKQVIELPPTHPEKSKRYYITFTIKSAQNYKDDDDDDDGDFFNDTKDFFKHRHAKSV